MARELSDAAKRNDPRQLRAERDARRRLSKTLKSQREKLSNGSDIKPEFEHELLSMFARNELGAAVTMPALSIFFSLSAIYWAPAHQAVLWLLIVIGAKVLLLEICRRFLAQPKATVNLKVWRRHLILAELLNGIAWAGFALVGTNMFASQWFGMPAQTGTEQTLLFSSHVFIFATLIILLAIRMTFASTLLPILHAGTIPMTLAVAGRLILLGDPFYLALASMAIGVHVYFIFLANGLNSTAIAMLEFRAEKDLLIADLEEEKSISDEARTRAESANAAKSRFLATMSHELRTPLNAIMGFSEVMKTETFGELNNPLYKDYANNIHESGEHLLKLINEILDLSRIEAGKYDLDEESIYLCDIAEDCVRLLKLRAESKGIDLVEDFQGELAPVWVDEKAVRQIILNLLSNALKFTPRGGTVVLSVEKTKHGGQWLSVADTGPGIPEDELPKVLEAFGQGSLAHETAEGGTGLGLPIARKLMQLHGGQLELASELRKGTVASIVFPPQRVLASVDQLQPLGRERHNQNAVATNLSAHEPTQKAQADLRPWQESQRDTAPARSHRQDIPTVNQAPSPHPQQVDKDHRSGPNLSAKRQPKLVARRRMETTT